MFKKIIPFKFLFLDTSRFLSNYKNITNKTFNFFSHKQKFTQKYSQNSVRWIKYAFGVSLFSAFAFYHYKKYKFYKYIIPEEESQYHIYDQTKVSSPVVRFIKYVIRFIHLLLIFLPSMTFLPLALFQRTFDFWMSIFLWSIQNAGVVWIKAFQCLSHRRDVIGEQMAKKFSCLRQNSPTHPEQQTKKIFKKVFGVKGEQMFDDFDQKAIASGTISQVYKAKFQGKIVVLKVRHPNVQKNIQRDIDILFFFSKVFSKISYHFQIPIKSESLKKILINQVYLTQQSNNLKKFNKIFQNSEIKFPIPHTLSNDEVLIESFSQGVPITFYIQHPHRLNKAIAMLGASAFFEMMMKHNFVHADCHGGNIYVRIQPNKKWYRPFENRWKSLQNWIIAHYTQISFDSPLLKKLANENYEYQKKVRKILQDSNQRVQITLLDVGMVINLNQTKKKAFGQFLQQVLKGNFQQCAKMIYNLSLKNEKQLQQQDTFYPNYLKDLQGVFQLISKTDIAHLEGIDVLQAMLKVIRKHNMIIDGEISILFTNMLVLQAIAKQLDPEINILRSAIPFLVHQGLEEISSSISK